MPKARSRIKPSPTKPYDKASKTKDNTTTLTKKASRGKDSHLYTDDNPSTTLHGTGFKDAPTAHHTINLVSSRSLLYQFQTINTMYHRAKHHPHIASSPNMQAAMEVFRNWLDETYPAAKAERVEYKPVLKRETVARFLGRIEREFDAVEGVERRWARMFIGLEGKTVRLANVLWEEGRPEGDDLGTVRDRELEKLTGGRTENVEEDLWDERGERVSKWHLRCIAFAWSPVGERGLRELG